MSEETLNDRLRKAAEMARQRQQGPGIPPVPPAAPQARPEANATSAPRTAPAPTPTPSPAPTPQQPFRPFGQTAPAPADTPAGDTPARPVFPEVDEFEPVKPAKPGIGKKMTLLLIILGVILAAAIAFLLFRETSHSREVQQLKEQQEQLELANQQLQLSNEYDQLNNEFAQYENQTSLLANDSIVQKYSAARAQVEKLLQELQNEKNKSAAQISKLKGEIETLKGILRTYVEQINELKQQNQQLSEENQQVKAENQQLSQKVEHVQADNRQLNERMTLAEKLNVTGVTLTALKKNGKTEKNVTKAAQLKVGFTVPQNNSTPVGQKVFYLRIINPEGDLLGNAGTFRFEGSTVGCTALKGIEYAGEEVHDQFYWNVTSTLTPGTYTVEIFTDGYRLCSRSFTLKK